MRKRKKPNGVSITKTDNGYHGAEDGIEFDIFVVERAYGRRYWAYSVYERLGGGTDFKTHRTAAASARKRIRELKGQLCLFDD